MHIYDDGIMTWTEEEWENLPVRKDGFIKKIIKFISKLFRK